MWKLDSNLENIIFTKYLRKICRSFDNQKEKFLEKLAEVVEKFRKIWGTYEASLRISRQIFEKINWNFLTKFAKICKLLFPFLASPVFPIPACFLDFCYRPCPNSIIPPTLLGRGCPVTWPGLGCFPPQPLSTHAIYSTSQSYDFLFVSYMQLILYSYFP